MGRNKKGFNWKARQVVKTEVIQTGEVTLIYVLVYMAVSI